MKKTIAFVLLLMAAMPFSYFVVQEYPNATSSTGAFTARNPATLAYDGNWNTFAQDADGGVVSYVYLNYSKLVRPSNETVDLAGTIWQTKGGMPAPLAPQTSNVTISFGNCNVNYTAAATYELRIALNDEPTLGIGSSYNQWQCRKAGLSTYVTLTNRQGGNAAATATAYEGWLFWDVQPRSNITVTCGNGCAAVKINGTTNGTIDLPYIPSADYLIEAEPLAGYVFSSWTDDNSFCTQGNTMSANTTASLTKGTCTITANFAIAPVTTCMNLTIANATYQMSKNISINGSTCINVQNTNITLNCNGYSITGNNSTATYGIFSDKNTTVIKNCVISNFQDGIRFNLADNGEINNVSASTTHSAGNGIYFNASSGNMLLNSRLSGTASRTLNMDGLYNNDNTIRNNTFINTKPSGAATLIYVGGQSNILLLNNFTEPSSASGMYAETAETTSNQFNATYEGKLQGNIWANVMNGSVEVKGNEASSIAGLYIGSSGTGYPYYEDTAFYKVSEYVVDWAPLTNILASTCIYGGSGNWLIQLSDHCNFTASTNIGSNYFVLNGSGTLSWLDLTWSGRGMQMASVGSAMMWNKGMTWFNFTG